MDTLRVHWRQRTRGPTCSSSDVFQQRAPGSARLPPCGGFAVG